jgi:hypothetical protein
MTGAVNSALSVHSRVNGGGREIRVAGDATMDLVHGKNHKTVPERPTSVATDIVAVAPPE